MNPCQLPRPDIRHVLSTASQVPCLPTATTQSSHLPCKCVCRYGHSQFKARLLKMTQLLWPPKPLQLKLFCRLSWAHAHVLCCVLNIRPSKGCFRFHNKESEGNLGSSQSCCLQPLSNQVGSWPCTIEVWDPDSLNSVRFSAWSPTLSDLYLSCCHSQTPKEPQQTTLHAKTHSLNRLYRPLMAWST